MKTNFTFDELSKVLASFVKVEAAAQKQIKAEAEYEEKSVKFNSEYEKNGYTFRNATDELHVLFDEKCHLMDVRDSAQRKAYKAIKDFAALIGVGICNDGWTEEEVKKYIKERKYYLVEDIVRYCEGLAKIAAKRL